MVYLGFQQYDFSMALARFEQVELRLHHMATNSVDVYREGYKQALESFNMYVAG